VSLIADSLPGPGTTGARTPDSLHGLRHNGKSSPAHAPQNRGERLGEQEFDGVRQLTELTWIATALGR
jgi:hypothetical protein